MLNDYILDINLPLKVRERFKDSVMGFGAIKEMSSFLGRYHFARPIFPFITFKKLKSGVFRG